MRTPLALEPVGTRRFPESWTSIREVLNLVHADLERGIKHVNGSRRKGARNGFRYTSEMVLRIILCRRIEGASYRDIAVRIDDSQYLQQFTRIFEGPMMDFTCINKLECLIRPETMTSSSASSKSTRSC
jgi:hypothetical protein